MGRGVRLGAGLCACTGSNILWYQGWRLCAGWTLCLHEFKRFVVLAKGTSGGWGLCLHAFNHCGPSDGGGPACELAAVVGSPCGLSWLRMRTGREQAGVEVDRVMACEAVPSSGCSAVLQLLRLHCEPQAFAVYHRRRMSYRTHGIVFRGGAAGCGLTHCEHAYSCLQCPSAHITPDWSTFPLCSDSEHVRTIRGQRHSAQAGRPSGVPPPRGDAGEAALTQRIVPHLTPGGLPGLPGRQAAPALPDGPVPPLPRGHEPAGCQQVTPQHAHEVGAVSRCASTWQDSMAVGWKPWGQQGICGRCCRWCVSSLLPGLHPSP